MLNYMSALRSHLVYPYVLKAVLFTLSVWTDVSKQCRKWSESTFLGVWSESTLFITQQFLDTGSRSKMDLFKFY